MNNKVRHQFPVDYRNNGDAYIRIWADSGDQIVVRNGTVILDFSDDKHLYGEAFNDLIRALMTAYKIALVQSLTTASDSRWKWPIEKDRLP